MNGVGGTDSIHGGDIPTVIWTEYMREALKGAPVKQFPEPEEIGVVADSAGRALPHPLGPCGAFHVSVAVSVEFPVPVPVPVQGRQAVVQAVVGAVLRPEHHRREQQRGNEFRGHRRRRRRSQRITVPDAHRKTRSPGRHHGLADRHGGQLTADRVPE